MAWAYACQKNHSQKASSKSVGGLIKRQKSPWQQPRAYVPAKIAGNDLKSLAQRNRQQVETDNCRVDVAETLEHRQAVHGGRNTATLGQI